MFSWLTGRASSDLGRATKAILTSVSIRNSTLSINPLLKSQLLAHADWASFCVWPDLLTLLLAGIQLQRTRGGPQCWAEGTDEEEGPWGGGESGGEEDHIKYASVGFVHVLPKPVDRIATRQARDGYYPAQQTFFASQKVYQGAMLGFGPLSSNSQAAGNLVQRAVCVHRSALWHMRGTLRKQTWPRCSVRVMCAQPALPKYTAERSRLLGDPRQKYLMVCSSCWHMRPQNSATNF